MRPECDVCAALAGTFYVLGRPHVCGTCADFEPEFSATGIRSRFQDAPARGDWPAADRLTGLLVCRLRGARTVMQSCRRSRAPGPHRPSRRSATASTQDQRSLHSTGPSRGLEKARGSRPDHLSSAQKRNGVVTAAPRGTA